MADIQRTSFKVFSEQRQLRMTQPPELPGALCDARPASATGTIEFRLEIEGVVLQSR